MTQPKVSSSNLLGVTLLAGVAGVGLGLLMAPRPGRETRARMRRTAMDASEQVQHGLESAKDASERFRSAIVHTGKQAKQDVHELSETAQAEMENPTTKQSPAREAWDEEV